MKTILAETTDTAHAKAASPPLPTLAGTVAAALLATGASPATITAARTAIAAGQVHSAFATAAQQEPKGHLAELFATADTFIQRAIDHQDATADEAPLEPGAECYGVKAGNARGNILNAEMFTTDDENPANRVSKISVWSYAADADLDLQQTDQFLADLEEFIPRLRALRNHLAPVEELRSLAEASSLLIEEWDETALAPGLRGKVLAHTAGMRDGKTLVIVPAGQHPVERLAAVRQLLSGEALS